MQQEPLENRRESEAERHAMSCIKTGLASGAIIEKLPIGRALPETITSLTAATVSGYASMPALSLRLESLYLPCGDDHLQPLSHSSAELKNLN